MKKLLQVFIPILCVPFLCGFLFDSKPKTSKKLIEARVLDVTATGEVVIDANNSMVKTKVMLDIFRTNGELTAKSDIEIPVARIIITQTTPTYSTGTIASKIDGSKAQIRDISRGMLCRETTKQTLKAEKKFYKKTLKSQGKLMRLKKVSKYEAKLNSWIGVDVNNLIASWGYPESSFVAPNGNKVYVYSQSSSYTKPMVTNINPYTHSAITYGGKTVEHWCNTYIEADNTGRIIKCTWKGNHCK
ncbi:MAG: hypothetical protein WC770_01470 [Phycisphaerae bacterium]|jgi:hypothetical protein